MKLLLFHNRLVNFKNLKELNYLKKIPKYTKAEKGFKETKTRGKSNERAVRIWRKTAFLGSQEVALLKCGLVGGSVSLE